MGGSPTINVFVYRNILALPNKKVKSYTPVESFIVKWPKQLWQICFFPEKDIKNKIETSE